jgi:hypothetical protein
MDTEEEIEHVVMEEGGSSTAKVTEPAQTAKPTATKLIPFRDTGELGDQVHVALSIGERTPLLAGQSSGPALPNAHTPRELFVLHYLLLNFRYINLGKLISSFLKYK